jgi:hypothetical protein
MPKGPKGQKRPADVIALDAGGAAPRQTMSGVDVFEGAPFFFGLE